MSVGKTSKKGTVCPLSTIGHLATVCPKQSNHLIIVESLRHAVCKICLEQGSSCIDNVCIGPTLHIIIEHSVEC